MKAEIRRAADGDLLFAVAVVAVPARGAAEEMRQGSEYTIKRAPEHRGALFRKRSDILNARLGQTVLRCLSFSLFILCFSGFLRCEESDIMYIDAIYDETTSGNPYIKGLDLDIYLTYAGFGLCYAKRVVGNREKPLIKEGKSGTLFVNKISKSQIDDCIGVKEMIKYFESIDNPVDYIERNHGACANRGRMTTCRHAILVSRVGRDFYTGKQTAPQYYTLLAFEATFLTGSRRPKGADIGIRWFQAEPVKEQTK